MSTQTPAEMPTEKKKKPETLEIVSTLRNKTQTALEIALICFTIWRCTAINKLLCWCDQQNKWTKEAITMIYWNWTNTAPSKQP